MPKNLKGHKNLIFFQQESNAPLFARRGRNYGAPIHSGFKWPKSAKKGFNYSNLSNFTVPSKFQQVSVDFHNFCCHSLHPAKSSCAYHSKIVKLFLEYHKVLSSNTSCLEAHAGFFRLLMKGIFNPYVLWPFDFLISNMH